MDISKTLISEVQAILALHAYLIATTPATSKSLSVLSFWLAVDHAILNITPDGKYNLYT